MPIVVGSHKDSCGIYVTNIKTMKIAPKYNNNCLNTFSIVTPPTFTPTKSVVPTGGVIVPIHKLKMIMIPKWMISIPRARHTGRKIGVKIKTAGVISMNVPTINKITLIKSKMMYLLSVIPRSASDTSCGMPVNAMTQDMIEETPIKKMMIPVICALSFKIAGTSLHFIDL